MVLSPGSRSWCNGIGSLCHRLLSISLFVGLMRLSVCGDLLRTAWGSMRLKVVFIDDVLRLSIQHEEAGTT